MKIKKITLLKLLIIVVVFSGKLGAQSFSVGGGISYGSEIEKAGLNLRGDFNIKDNMRISPGFTLFFINKHIGSNYTSTTSMWEFNADFNYIFKSEELGFYPIIGINIAQIRVKTEYSAYYAFLHDINVSDTEFGLNVGAGIEYNIDKLLPFMEVKYVLSDYDQAVLTFGVKFKID